jgi:hypothetical protein
MVGKNEFKNREICVYIKAKKSGLGHKKIEIVKRK